MGNVGYNKEVTSFEEMAEQAQSEKIEVTKTEPDTKPVETDETTE